MSDNTITVLKGVRNKLLASAALTALVGNRIYNKVPQNSSYPIVSIRNNSEFMPVINASQAFKHRVRIQCWSQASLEETINIRSAIFEALHRQEITLDAPSEFYGCQAASLIDAFLEDDSQTWQGIIEFDLVAGSI